MVKSLYSKRDKKGQAAIEFLMTYGWMLLVVLIVGALIFSFVDFGNLLPNQLTLSNDLRADSTAMVADEDAGTVDIIFTYLGTRAGQIDPTRVSLTDDAGVVTCGGSHTVRNLDQDTSSSSDNVSFINGELGGIQFNCDDTAMISGAQLEGEVSIPISNARTELTTTSRGRIRIGID